LTVTHAPEVAIAFALPGHQPQTIAVRPDGASPPRLLPNPVYAELQPVAPPRQKKKAPAKKKVAKKAAPAPAPTEGEPPPPPPQTQGGGGSPYPQNYPWPPPPPPQ
jgi:hypothetical protein